MYAITFSSFKEVYTAGFYRKTIKVGGAVCEVQNKIGKGKIDLILTKSVSRYARNIVDCISYIRKLKALGIGIYFEEQNINSLTDDSEVYIGIYGVLAQSESENISANVKWGINKRMQNGTYNCRFNLLGYRRDKETKEIYMVPEEAEVVKMIFQMYLQGKSLGQIKAYLESNEIKTINGKSVWDKSTVKGILINEKLGYRL